jgi:hypothetical protein
MQSLFLLFYSIYCFVLVELQYLVQTHASLSPLRALHQRSHRIMAFILLVLVCALLPNIPSILTASVLLIQRTQTAQGQNSTDRSLYPTVDPCSRSATLSYPPDPTNYLRATIGVASVKPCSTTVLTKQPTDPWSRPITRAKHNTLVADRRKPLQMRRLATQAIFNLHHTFFPSCSGAAPIAMSVSPHPQIPKGACNELHWLSTLLLTHHTTFVGERNPF